MDKNIELIVEYEKDKCKFVEKLKCVICKLNAIYSKNICIYNFSDGEIFELFIYDKQKTYKNDTAFFGGIYDVKIIILNFAITLLAITTSAYLFKESFKFEDIKQLIIPIIGIFVVVIIIAFIFWEILFKDIAKDKNIIIEINKTIHDIDFLNHIINMKYK